MADFDGDTNLDVMYGTGGGNSGAGILWGSGDGTFPSFVQVYSSLGVCWIDVADIDNDGDTDAVVSPPATILRNNGNGTFATVLLDPLGGFGHVFGELNGDGWPDLGYAATENAPVCTIPPAINVRLNDGAPRRTRCIPWLPATRTESSPLNTKARLLPRIHGHAPARAGRVHDTGYPSGSGAVP